ncbi:PLD nuclease N-terminal domain-containing protein [Mesobacillus maritimus]|uniref:PLD nuclease N-terminal domain-containing protein n=1 Tax=Mesobacillus maritimus TaxID=1643336 RepID=UPI0020411E2E|nr:PLD nuclease N-terminal domain-containing protein [Mesobacillus maritimus]MCM3584781.1 PLD nuclease N-terminal domain-containing protein [Mesobacillus maritimus]MCM3671850.1 PLD nuclease N-terminal domain-containing protein [Mesobacillus maritimus]
MGVLTEVNWALIAPLIVLQLILMVFALVNCVKQEETNGPKWMWILIIIFVNIVGPVLYFLMGRKNG